MTLADLNRAGEVQFVAALAGIYEHSPWIPESAWSRRPSQASPGCIGRWQGYDRRGVIAEFVRRLDNDRDVEFAECLRQIDEIARLRLEAQIAR